MKHSHNMLEGKTATLSKWAILSAVLGLIFIFQTTVLQGINKPHINQLLRIVV